MYVELPQGYNVSQVGIPSLRLFVDGKGVTVQPSPVEVGDYNSNGVPDLMVKLDGRTFAGALSPYPGMIEVSIIGYLTNGDIVAGSDQVKIVN